MTFVSSATFTPVGLRGVALPGRLPAWLAQ